MRRQQLISPNEMVFCTCTKCELQGWIADNTLLDIQSCCKYNVTKLVVETLCDGIVGELFKNTHNRLNKH